MENLDFIWENVISNGNLSFPTRKLYLLWIFMRKYEFETSNEYLNIPNIKICAFFICIHKIMALSH